MGKSVSEIKSHIQKVYSAYGRPFVVGFSGGKDSTATLQVLWEAIAELPPELRKNDIHVIATDTLVETPYVIEYVKRSLSQINKAAESQGLPIKAHRLTPEIHKTFWVNLTGKGYPAPSSQFRWCTERLKISPVNRFISENVDSWGEVTVVLGARISESATRNQAMTKRLRDAMGLTKHNTMAGAFVYTPIESWSTDDVWSYLLQTNNPWGGSNRDLSAMYQNASGGECPTVVDKSTPSCGSSRFGCWVCTVVQRDTSMENLIDNGEEWMIPLLELRNFLSSTQDPEKKAEYRNNKRRNGRIQLVRDGGKISLGPYKMEWRKEILRRLLKAQVSIIAQRPDDPMSLITLEELKLIRQIWQSESYDWHDSVSQIYSEVTGHPFPTNLEDGVRFGSEDLKLLTDLCRAEGVPVDMVARLIDEERRLDGMSRRVGIVQRIDKILAEDWETALFEKEVRAQ